MGECVECQQAVETLSSRLACEGCAKAIHVACLKSALPTSLLGDNYFVLTCSSCSPNQLQVVKRDKVNW